MGKDKNKIFSFMKNESCFRSARKLPVSMSTPIPRPSVVRRPWIDFLKSNRETWIREAG